MNRRDSTIAIGLLAAIPFAARGQTAAKPYRIGFLGVSSATDYAPQVTAFVQGLRALGYEEGRTIVIEYRWADGREERLPALAAELVRIGPDVLVSHATGVRALQQATSTIPIVMGVSGDPVGFGLIKSLAKPGGNITGVASQIVDLAPKRLELLKEAVPNLRTVAVLASFAQPSAKRSLDEMEAVAGGSGLRLRSYALVADAGALDAAFSAVIRDRPDALLVQPDPLTSRHSPRIASFAAKYRLPSIGGGRQYAVDGGLIAYGGNFLEGWRLAARYVDRILRGAKPGDLPVEQPTSYELVINRKAARALGLALPQSLLLRANEVIE